MVVGSRREALLLPAPVRGLPVELQRTLRIAFHFVSNAPGLQGRGWYVDDVQVLGSVTDVGEQAPSRTPSLVLLYPNAPNPFNPSTTISFWLPASAFADLVILDVAGHLVRRVALGRVSPGLHQQLWDGCDSGRAVSSGVYLYQLQTPNRSATRRMVLVR